MPELGSLALEFVEGFGASFCPKMDIDRQDRLIEVVEDVND